MITYDTIPQALSQIIEELAELRTDLKKSTTNHNQIDEVLTVSQAAVFLSLTVPTIYGLISKREIPHFKRSRRVYFSRDELINYLKAGRCKTNSEIGAEAA